MPLTLAPEPSLEQPPAAQPSQFEIGLNEREAEGIYSNLVFIAHGPSEVILDFARALPGLPKPRVFARIIMTPQHAKSLMQALEQNLGNYEKTFGAITLPGDPNAGRPKGEHLGFTT